MAEPDEMGETERGAEESPEQTWQSPVSPSLLFELLDDARVGLSPRKRRLLAVAACRRVSDWLVRRRSIVAVTVAERYADGCATEQDVREALVLARAGSQEAAEIARRVEHVNDSLKCVLAYVAEAAVLALEGEVEQVLDLIEAASGRSFLRIRFRYGYVDDPSQKWFSIREKWRDQARTEHAALLRELVGNPFRPVQFDPAWRDSAVTALARGMYDGRAFDRMPILADALQDAGCTKADILNHCRDPNQVHVRGCWVVDLVLEN